MTAPTCSLLAVHGMPVVVTQALSDVSLTPTARLMMWHLKDRLDFLSFRDIYGESLAREMRIKETTVGQTLTLLVARGYLEENGKKRPRAFRLPWSRRITKERLTKERAA